MRKPRPLYLFLIAALTCLTLGQTATARDVMRFKRYTMQDGLSHRIISGLMQDSTGYIWLATWNGLCRFDGETFITYNETSDGEKVGRTGLVRSTTDGKVWVIRQSDNQEYLFNPATELLDPIKADSVRCIPIERLTELNEPDAEGLLLMHDSCLYRIPYEGAGLTTNSHYTAIRDRQDNIWANFDDALYQITFGKAPYEHIDLVDPQHNEDQRYGDEIRSMLRLRDGGFLLGCKNSCIYKYNADWQFEGYLTPQGTISRHETSFNARVYAMTQAADGSVWMGSRGQGLWYVCSPDLDQAIRQQGRRAAVRNYRDPLLRNNNIFDLCFTSPERLIVATWNGGVQLMHTDSLGNASNIINNEKVRKARRIFVLNPNLLALCSTQGIIFTDHNLKELRQLGTMDFSDMLQSLEGTFYASTLSGGIFTFSLRNNPTQQDLDSLRLQKLEVPETDNIIVSMLQSRNGELWFVSDNQLVRYNQGEGSAQVLDRVAFGTEVTFGEARPLLNGEHLVLGTTVGRMHIELGAPEGYCPNLMLNTADTLCLVWGDEAPEVRATALDYRLPRLIQYAWRELPDSVWIPLGSTGQLRLSNLWPGTHRIELRSTDAKGIWADNVHTLTVIVSLSTWHKCIGFGLILILLLLIFLGWKASHRDKPEVLHRPVAISGIQPSAPVIEERDQQFIAQVTKVVEEHIDDPMLDVEKLTGYMNTSRTILYTKFKDLLDTTPAAFITEIRLKRAIQLLESRQYRVNEVAVMCGFSDPKYFTRHFKQRMGVTPVKFLENSGKNQ